MIFRRQLKKTVMDIAEALIKNNANDTSMPVGLLIGKAGQILFYGHLYQCFGKETHFQQFSTLMNECIDWVADNPTDATLSGGFTGLMWVIQHFIRVGLLDKQAAHAIADWDEYIITSFKADCTRQNYDLLHGLIGKGMYFLECFPDKKNNTVLKLLIDHLESFAVIEADTVSWHEPSILGVTTNGSICNLGMAHGMPSIIGFLSKVHRREIATNQTRGLLEQSIKWLLEQRQSNEGSHFSNSTAQKGQSRLAWCYGDLGPALALFHAAYALNRDDWRNQALYLAQGAGQRTVEQAGLYQSNSQGWLDAGFCHGTSGIAHIFNRFYQVSKQPEFKQCAEYWLALSTPLLPIEQGIAGYVYPDFDANNNSQIWQNNSALLDGATGTGLVMLSFLKPQQSLWDEIVMTDIQC